MNGEQRRVVRLMINAELRRRHRDLLNQVGSRYPEEQHVPSAREDRRDYYANTRDLRLSVMSREERRRRTAPPEVPAPVYPGPSGVELTRVTRPRLVPWMEEWEDSVVRVGMFGRHGRNRG